LNARNSDIQAALRDTKSDLQGQITELRTDMLRENQTTRDLLRTEFHRVEEVLDARLRHLEERD